MDDYPKRCPSCGRPIEELRFGVAFTRCKAAIIDKIKSRNGARIMAKDMGEGFNKNTIRAHIYQINEKLMDSDYRIEGKPGPDGGYRVVKRKCAR